MNFHLARIVKIFARNVIILARTVIFLARNVIPKSKNDLFFNEKSVPSKQAIKIDL